MKTLRYAVALGALGALLPTSASAQDAAPIEAQAAQASGYERFVQAISPDELHEATFATTMAQLRQYYREDTTFVLLEKDCPGVIEAVLSNESIDDLLRIYHWKEAEAVRQLILEISQDYLTEEQAHSAADVYLSPVGRKLIMAVGSNVNYRNTFNDAAYSEDGKVGRENFDRDQRASVSGAINALTKEEIEHFGMMVARSDWFSAFQKMNPAMQQARFEVLNSELIPGYQDQLNAAMQEAMTAYLATCE